MQYRLLTYAIATVWLVNGLYCKVLHGVPRHQQIVARILGEDHARFLTQLIGFSEILLAVWILSFRWTRACATIQIILVISMNIIELIVTPDLLLFGRLNALNALLFVSIVYYTGFVHLPKRIRPS